MTGTATIGQWGNALGFRIPREVQHAWHLHRGSKVKLDLREDKLVMEMAAEEPAPSPERSMKQIIADYKATHAGQLKVYGKELDWGEPQGAEIW
jgi:antitoxin component of MazEF toxin-antitoxin module